jgi:YesN/AraC family two-component response regulator
LQGGIEMKENNVLFIDDELNILASLRRGLMDEEYKCFFTDNGQEALELMDKYEISVVVTDMRMPKMNGLQFLKECKQKYPNTVRIVMSGYTQLPQMLATINQGDIFKFIPKPWNLEEEFKPAINEGVKYYNLKKKTEQLSSELIKRNELYQNILRSTNAKFAAFQNEIDMMKKTAAYTFDSISQQLGSSNEAGCYIDLYKNLYTGYLNSLFSENIEFDIKRMILDLKTSVRNDDYENKINVDIPESSSIRVFGNYKLFHYILYYSCKSLIKIGLDKVILLKLNLGKNEDGTKLEYIVMGRLTQRANLFKDSKDILIMKKQIEILQSYLSEVSKNMNGEIMLKVVDGNVLLEFSGNFPDEK